MRPRGTTGSLPELFASAGDWDCARAAVENGADAVYFGLGRFNARMRAQNFTEAASEAGQSCEMAAALAVLSRRAGKHCMPENWSFLFAF